MLQLSENAGKIAGTAGEFTTQKPSSGGMGLGRQ